MNDLIERKSIRNMYSCLNPEDKVRVEQVLIDIDAIPSARPNNRGICGVCAGRKVCGKNNRNLDMLECSIFELDEHYKISRPKGEWIDISEWYSPYQKCSICEKIVEGYGSNFCPNCGADMRDRKDE